MFYKNNKSNKQLTKNFLIFLLLLCGFWRVQAQDLQIDIPNPKITNANAFVSNYDGILSIETENQLNELLYNLEQETEAEVAVVAVNSIDYQNITSFSNTLFNSWGIGKKDKNNGVLILFVLDVREIRFEIGYGLEGILPDAICKRIQMQKIIPEFKNGNYDEGILAGVESVAEIIKNDGKITDNSLKKSKLNISGWLIFSAIFLIFSMIYMINNSQKIKNNNSLKTNRDRYFAMKKKQTNFVAIILTMLFTAVFFGLFLIFTGVSVLFVFLAILIALFSFSPAAIFGQIRANKFRRQTIFCNACQHKMTHLDEQKDNDYLTDKQCFEEYIKSVDYDVFLCENCQNNIIFAYEKSQYQKCPQCKARAYSLTKKEIVEQPTALTSGKEQATYCCRFCNHTDVKYKTLPRYTHSSGGYRSGGFGGSSGRSSGGSFGGGRSGGGGATSRW